MDSWFWVSFVNGISTFLGYLMLKPSSREKQELYYLTHSWKDKELHTFFGGVIQLYVRGGVNYRIWFGWVSFPNGLF